MNDFFKMIMPIALTLMLSGLGTSVYDLYAKVNRLSDTLKENTKYAVIIQQLRKEVDDHEARLRVITQACLTHAEIYNNEENDYSNDVDPTYFSASRRLD